MFLFNVFQSEILKECASKFRKLQARYWKLHEVVSEHAFADDVVIQVGQHKVLQNNPLILNESLF